MQISLLTSDNRMHLQLLKQRKTKTKKNLACINAPCKWVNISLRVSQALLLIRRDALQFICGIYELVKHAELNAFI